MQKTWVKRNGLRGKTSQNYYKSFMFWVNSRLIPDCSESIIRWLREVLHGSLMPLQSSAGWARAPESMKKNCLKKNSVANLRIESRCAGLMFCLLLCITETYEIFSQLWIFLELVFIIKIPFIALWFWINPFYCAIWLSHHGKRKNAFYGSLSGQGAFLGRWHRLNSDGTDLIFRVALTRIDSDTGL